MAMGRPTKGLGHVEDLDADTHCKERLKAILSALSGTMSVQDASASVGLRPARFGELRRTALQGAVDALAPGRPGRPPVCDAEEAEQTTELERENERLRRELERARLQLEIAQAAPSVLRRAQKRGSARMDALAARIRGRGASG